MNEIQFLGSHNSYKQAIEPALLEMLAADNPAVAESLDYAHMLLAEQLNMGLRKVELDIYYDPEGGLYAKPMGLEAVQSKIPYDSEGVMTRPGFKVFHVQDIDFRSSCLLFVTCLEQVAGWSDAHPRHLPIYITINAKDDVIERPGFVRPLKFNAAAWRSLDAEIESTLGDRLLTPDDIRGDAATLREAVLEGWPKLDAVRGKIVFVLDDSTAKKQSYVKDHPSLAGRTMFVDVPEDTPEAAIRIVNDPLKRKSYIQDLVRAGFIVRTRADADTREARSGDLSRFQAALDSGAQIISTDYYVADKRFGHDFIVQMPDNVVARCDKLLIRQPCSVND